MADFVTDRQHGKIFQIQDNDRPMFVIAGSWGEAVSLWKRAIAIENECVIEEVEEPKGVALVCEEDEWITSANVGVAHAN